MKALVFNTAGDYRDVLRLAEIKPSVLTPAQAKIKVKASPVNPSDLYFIQGVYRRKPVFPQIAGLEGSGIVIETGSAVTLVKEGDYVAFHWPGTWAEEIAVDEVSLIKIGQSLLFEVAAQIGLNGLTAYALLEQSQLKSGDHLLPDAANSSLSALLIQLAVTKKINIIVLVRDLSGASKLQEWGASVIIKQDDPHLTDKVEQHIGKNRISCFIDSVGGEIVTKAISLMAPSGIILICGNMSGGAAAMFTNPQISYGLLTIRGFGIDNWISRHLPAVIRDAYQSLLNDVCNGRLVFSQTISMQMKLFPDIELAKQKIILVNN